MIVFALLLLLTVVLPPLGFGPPMYRGAWSRNWMLGVVAPPRDTPHARGIEAQEVVEWWLAWVAACLLALPVALLGAGLLGEVAALVAAFAGNAVARIATGHFDLVGHNVEIIVEQRAGFADYRAGEIARMIGPLGDQKGMPRAHVDARLRRWEWLARIALAVFKRRYG